MTIGYWDVNGRIDKGVWISIILILIVCTNLCGVKSYGEAEFFFSILKVIAIVAFVILGVIIIVGGAPNHHYITGRRCIICMTFIDERTLSFRVDTWTSPGAFLNAFKGFCSVFVTAAFAFGGAELVGLAATESDNPRKSLPKATKQTFWRITLFYVVTLFLVGLIVPFNHPRLLGNNGTNDATASPLAIAIQDAGIDIFPSILNGVILISSVSVGNWRFMVFPERLARWPETLHFARPMALYYRNSSQKYIIFFDRRTRSSFSRLHRP